MKNKRGFSQLFILFGLLIIAAALPIAGKLVEKNQDNRNRAAYDCPETTRPTTSCVINGVKYAWTCNAFTGLWQCIVTAPVATATPYGMLSLTPTSTKIPTLTQTPTLTPIPTIDTSTCTGQCITYGGSCFNIGRSDAPGKCMNGGFCCTTLYMNSPTPVGGACVGQCVNYASSCGNVGLGVAQGICANNGICCTKTSQNQPTPTPASCFLPGTKVRTTNGTKNIEEVEIGEKVVSFKDDGTLGVSTVSKMFETKRNEYFKIVTDKSEVRVTGEHPFFMGNGKYVEVKNLKAGDGVFVFENGTLEKAVIKNIEKINASTLVYNLTSQGDNTYFANDFAVHNKQVEPFPDAICTTSNYQSVLNNLCMNKYGVSAATSNCSSTQLGFGPVSCWSGIVGGTKSGFCCVDAASYNALLTTRCVGTKVTVNTTLINGATAANLSNVSFNGWGISIGTNSYSPVGYKCVVGASKNCAQSAVQGIYDVNSVQITTSSEKCTPQGTLSGYCCP